MRLIKGVSAADTLLLLGWMILQSATNAIGDSSNVLKAFNATGDMKEHGLWAYPSSHRASLLVHMIFACVGPNLAFTEIYQLNDQRATKPPV